MGQGFKVYSSSELYCKWPKVAETMTEAGASMADQQRQMLDVYLQEYGKLKDEQAQRIGFRDNLL